MGKYNLSTILAITEFFEKKATRLLALADLSSEEHANAVSFSNSSLARRLVGLLNINPTLEEWSRWLDVNKTVLGGIRTDLWLPAGDYINMARRTTEGLIEAFISKSSAPPSPDFELKISHVLKASGPVPTLFLQIGTIPRMYGHQEPIPPQLAHDAWLVDAVKSLTGFGYYGEELKDIFEFIKKNEPTIRKIRASFEKSVPELLGGGADGVAFNIGGGKVLKIFKDQRSFIKAKMAVDRLHKNPELAKTEAMIYDIGEFDPLKSGLGEKKLYYYIIEQMQPVGGTYIADHINDVRWKIIEILSLSNPAKWKPLREKVKDPTQHAFVRDKIKEIVARTAPYILEDMPDKINGIETELKLQPDWLENFIEEVIVKYLTYRQDLHMGNLGVTRYGQLRYFDPTYGAEGSELV